MARKPKDKGKRPTKREAALEDDRLRDKKLREKYFMGRRDLLGKFEKLLVTPPKNRNVWSIYGIGGIGKSWLLAELEERAINKAFLVSYLSVDSPSVEDLDSFFIALWEPLSKQNPALLTNTNETVARYFQIQKERSDTRKIPGLRAAKELFLEACKDIPVIRRIVKKLEMWSEQAQNNFLEQFPQIMLESLIEDIKSETGDVVVEIAFLIDTFERCSPIVSAEVQRLIKSLRKHALFVIAGRESLLEKHLPRGEGWEARVKEHKLLDLKKEEIREKLEPGAGPSDEADTYARRVEEATTGFPLLVTFVLETLGKKGLEELQTISLGRKITEKERQDFLRDRIVEVLEKLDSDSANSLRIAAFPRRFNGTLFSTLFEKLETGRGSLELSKYFKKIKEYSFVRSEGEWFHCHMVLQDAVRSDWLEENKKLWETMHKVCRGYFGKEKGLAAFLERIFHDYKLRPFESWQEFAANYHEWSGEEESRTVADTMLEDFSSFCAQTGAVANDEEIFQVFDGVDTLLFEYPRGDRAALCLRRIDLLEAAKAAVTDSVREASLNNSIGIAWSDLPTGDRAENVEKAIRHYELALEVWTHEAYPADWATTQNNLGAAYIDRVRGERAENVESAIEHYTQALEVYTREAFPERWAMTQNNLGVAYRNRIRGERAENVESAIEHYTQALEVYTREAFPERWAMTQNNLGVAYSDRVRGERAENVEKAIEHYMLALQVYTRETFPVDWAKVHNNLGIAYRNRICGERAENVESAIEHYTQALEVYTREAFPTDWARTQYNLGITYRNRIRGERAENIESAIEHYTRALDVYTRESLPIDFGETKHNLALVYLEDDFPLPEKELLEIALGHLNEACEVLDSDFPVHSVAFEKRGEVKARLRELEEEGGI